VTEKLYYKNPYQFEFDASVISSFKDKQGVGVVLDRTCFYPEGGGQPSDTGWLNQTPVLDVRLKDGKIVHYVDGEVSSTEVHGKIDAVRRLDFMQQHTGQHILSQSLLQACRFNTVSVHFGEDITTIEMQTPAVTKQELEKVEELANSIIMRNLPVKVHWVSPEEVPKFNVRRPPPDVNEIRLVEIEGFDVTACGGTHLARTGEVGLIKIVGLEKIRGRVRLLVKIGKRVLAEYGKKNELVQELVQTLTCGQEDIIPRIRTMQMQLKEFQREISGMESRLMANEAQAALSSATEVNGKKIVKKIFRDADYNKVKAFTDEIISEPNRVVVGMNVNGEQLRWIIAHSLAAELDMRQLIEPLLHIIEGKGGGRPNMLQGGGKNPGGVEKFLEKLDHDLQQELTK
jgi:alanyl-tRNA synthetase